MERNKKDKKKDIHCTGTCVLWEYGTVDLFPRTAGRQDGKTATCSVYTEYERETFYIVDISHSSNSIGIHGI